MRIGIDIRCLMQPNYSGVAEYTYNLLKNLFESDRDNEYLLFYNAQQDVKANLPRFDYENVQFKSFKYPNKLFNLSLKLFKFPKINDLLGGVDIFFIPNLNFIALSKKCKRVITIHDLSYEIFTHFFSPKRKWWHKIINPHYLISTCDKIIAVSKNTKNDLINLYKIPDSNIEVIHSGVDHQIYKRLERSDYRFNEIIKKYQLPEKFIFFLGTLEPRKNVEGLIEAFNQLKKNQPDWKNLNLVIAGDKGWHYQEIFELIEKSPYKNQIKYLGYIKKGEKPFLYNLAELFVFPSYYEGFGLPVLEAQACGTPVIAGLNSSFSEIAGDSAFLVNVDNITEINQAILQILNENELKDELIIKGLKNVKRFSWKKTALQTLKILTS